MGFDLFKKKSKGVDAVLEDDSPFMPQVDPSTIDVESIHLDSMRILLVEDNVLNREIAEYLLTNKGAKVEFAENGKIAVAKFEESEEHYYDCILMDIVMPIMDGYEATKLIRKLKHPDAKTVPIVAMTANNLKEDIAWALKYGMNAHIAKPIKTSILLQTVSAYSPKQNI